MTRKSIIFVLILGFGIPGLARGDDGYSQEDTSDTLLLQPRSPSDSSTFEINLSVDLPIILTGILIGRSSALMGIRIHQDMEQLDPKRLNKMDRTVLGNWSSTARLTSDVLRNTIWALPFVISFFDAVGSDSDNGFSGFGKDVLVLAEVVAVESMVTSLTKYIVHRPRPYAYDSRLSYSKRHEGNASTSFYSGHTALSFSMATSYSYLFTRRHPDSPLVVPLWIGTHAIAASTAFLRVEAGKHFWSDVLVGAVVGSAIGFVVPYLHTAIKDSRQLTGNLMVLPLFYEGGFGASATLVF